MTGEVGGLAGLLKRINPYLVSVHCIARRLALATSQATDKVSYLFTPNVYYLVQFIHTSVVPHHVCTVFVKLKMILMILNYPTNKFMRFGGYLSNMQLRPFRKRCMPSLATYFEEKAAEGA